MCWPRLTCSKGLRLNRHWSKRILHKIVTLADCIQETDVSKMKKYICVVNRRYLRGNFLLNQRYHPGLMIPSKLIKQHFARHTQSCGQWKFSPSPPTVQASCRGIRWSTLETRLQNDYQHFARLGIQHVNLMQFHLPQQIHRWKIDGNPKTAKRMLQMNSLQPLCHWAFSERLLWMTVDFGAAMNPCGAKVVLLQSFPSMQSFDVPGNISTWCPWSRSSAILTYESYASSLIIGSTLVTIVGPAQCCKNEKLVRMVSTKRAILSSPAMRTEVW